jgi:hypothetical protein
MYGVNLEYVIILDFMYLTELSIGKVVPVLN